MTKHNIALMPNLFVIGASKSGSSALHAYLKHHPDIRMSDEKEPCYFVDQEELKEAWPIMARNPASHDLDAYLALFSGGEHAAFRCEASVYYSQSPHRSGVPERIAAAVPDARIIYLVREPVARTIGHCWQRIKEFQERLPLPEAVQQNPLYRDTSDYGMQLGRYLEVFDRTQIHIIAAEDLRKARRETLQSLFEWLGVNSVEYTDEQLKDVHRSPEISRRERFPGVKAVRDSAVWARARALLPKSVVDALRSAGSSEFDKNSVDMAPVEDWLCDYFAERIPAFEKLAGREFPAWRRA